MIQQTNYIDGLEWGKYYEWWPNGNKKTDGTFKAGLMQGRWKFFNEKGKYIAQVATLTEEAINLR